MFLYCKASTWSELKTFSPKSNNGHSYNQDSTEAEANMKYHYDRTKS